MKHHLGATRKFSIPHSKFLITFGAGSVIRFFYER